MKDKGKSFKKLKGFGQHIFFVKVAVCFTILYFTLILTISTAFPYCLFPQFILGALFAHMKELQHETLHGPIQYKFLNRFFGVILGAPMLVSYSDYKYYHMIHHEFIGTEKDSEYFTYSPHKSSSIFKFFLSLFMTTHYKNIFKKIVNTVFFNKSEIKQDNIKEKIKNEYQLLMILILSMIGSSMAYGSLLIFKLSIIPLVLFTLPLNFLIELPEHVLCNKTDTSVFSNSRTIKSNWFLYWYTNGNNYHVEHHYAPHYPISALPSLHLKIKEKIIYLHESYADFYKKFFKQIAKPEQIKETSLGTPN